MRRLTTTIVVNPDEPSVLVYEPCGGHYGYIRTYRHDGKGFVCASAQDISVGDGTPDENNRRMAELFPVGRTLKWTKVTGAAAHGALPSRR